MTTEVDYLTDSIPLAPVTGTPEGVYELNEDHTTEALNLLIEFFKHGPRNQAFLTAVMAQVQELEQEAWDVYTSFDVDTAVGDQLDIIGTLVGEGRGDYADDDEYRAGIRVRTLVNRSEGKLEELVAIADGIGGTSIYVREAYPATIHIEFDTFGGSNLSTAYRLLKEAKPAAVKLHVTGPASTNVWGAVDGNPAGVNWGGATAPGSGLWVGGL